MRKVLITSAFAFVFAAPAISQAVAIRYILGETHKIYQHPTFDNYCMGLGVDRTFNDRFTAGFDVTYDIGHALKLGEEYIYLGSSASQVTYEMKPKLLSLTYHTEYALGENDGTHVYIGTYLGLRHLSQNWILQQDYDPYNTVSRPYPAMKKISQWLVPVGLRMGVRGATDGGFMDFYAALGYQIGGGKQVADGTLYRPAAEAEYLETSSLAVTIGLAYGIGW